MISRRLFFRNVALLFTGVLAMAGCDRGDKEAPKQSVDNSVLPDEKFRSLLDSFVDTIVPEDEYPGAVSAGVPAILLARFVKKPENREKTDVMLKRINLSAHVHYGKPFSSLDQEHRVIILRKTEMSGYPDDRPARDQIRRLRSRIITEFYLSDSGRAMLGYTPPYPGGYPDYNRPPPA